MAFDAEEFVLSHAYDPVKAHEYYLRTRQLKGRKKGSKVTSSRTTKKTFSKTAEQRREEAHRRVLALQARLEVLQETLAKLVREAQPKGKQKSATKPNVKSSRSDKGSNGSKPKKLTAQQKVAAAKRSKEYYEKNKKRSLSEQARSLEGKIKTLEKKIKTVRAQKARTGSVRASKSTSHK